MKSHTPSAPAGHRFKFVGLHIDLRVQAMPFRALCRMAKQAADFGINTLVVEWEAAFPFRKHRVISNAFAYTPEEIRRFIAFAVYFNAYQHSWIDAMGQLLEAIL